MEVLVEILAVFNIIFAGLLAYLSIENIRLKLVPYPWLSALYAFVGVYWCVLYVFIAVTEPQGNPVWFGQIFVRPMFVFTLATMVAGAILRRRTRIK